MFNENVIKNLGSKISGKNYLTSPDFYLYYCVYILFPIVIKIYSKKCFKKN